MPTEITNCDELKAEVAKTEAGNKDRQAAIISRALELGCVEHIPDDWGIEVKTDAGNGNPEK